MSFILDALKKAEHARPPASMPQMPAVSVAAIGLRQRRRLPGWLIAGAGALAMLLVVAVGWQIMREPGIRPAPERVATAPGIAGPIGSGANAAQLPATTAAEFAQPRQTEVRPLDSEARAGQPALAPADNLSSAQAQARSGVSRRNGTVTPGTVVYESAAPAGQGGSVRYQRNFANDTPESAPDAAPEPAQPAATLDSGTPSYHNMKLRSGGLPTLHMDIHVFSQDAKNRFVFINSRKYRQGQTTREGVLIEEITPTGATMSYRGERFAMARN